jgi:arylsulfatase A-like enzyme
MKKIILGGLIAASIFSCQGQKKAPQKKAEKPNIVFLFTDDQTYTSIHALGNEEIITPNFDRLVNQGTTFTNAYNMGSWSGAVCLASRAMMNSGLYVWRAEQRSKEWHKGQNVDKSWGKLMASQGYDTYMTGKWHVSASANKMFEYTSNVRPGMPEDEFKRQKIRKKIDSLKRVNSDDYASIMPLGYNRPLGPDDHSWSPSDPKHGGFWKGGKHWSEVLKDDALTFIDQAKSKEAPFFMYLAFNAPHDPRQAPQEFVDMYPLDNISVPESFLPEYPYRHQVDLGSEVRDEALAPFPRTEYAVKVHKQEYYASITHLDAQIGLILDALEASGKMDNTYIFLSSDHGLAMGRHGLLGKQNLYDHSIRPPMILLGPDIPKNNKVTADVYLQDVMATSLELAGLSKPDYIEFNSFYDLAKGEQKESHYDAIYGGYKKVQRMIRKDGYKLLVYPKAKKVRLYHIEKDPNELNDLADKPKFAAKVKSLLTDLIALQEAMDDDVTLNFMNDLF